MQKQKDAQKIIELKDGQETRINWSEESGFIVERKGNYLEVWYVPLYGGDEQFEGRYPLTQVPAIIELAYS